MKNQFSIKINFFYNFFLGDIRMDNLNLNLKDLKLSKEDSRDIIELLAKKRNIKTL